MSRTQCKWSTVEKEAYAIHFALQKLDHYLHGAEFVIKTDHKPLKYLLDSPMQNEKIELWAVSMAGYNCKIQYIAGTTNTCADLLLRKPDSVYIISDELKKGDEVPLDINDNTFQVNMKESNQFHPKEFASCDIPFTYSLVKPKQYLPEFDMVSEQNKDDEILELKTILKHGEPSKDIQRKHLIADDILYYLTDPDSDPVMILCSETS